MARKMLPYIGIPILAAAWLALRYRVCDAQTIIRAEMLIVFGYVAAYSDLKTRRVPNRLVLTMLAAWAAFMAVYIVFDTESALELLIPSLIGGAAGGGFFLFLYIVSRRGIGGGDVKLIAVMGLFLTFAKLMPVLFFSSLLTAVVSAVLLVTKRATMKTAIPLVPFLYVGTLITIFI